MQIRRLLLPVLPILFSITTSTTPTTTTLATVSHSPAQDNNPTALHRPYEMTCNGQPTCHLILSGLIAIKAALSRAISAGHANDIYPIGGTQTNPSPPLPTLITSSHPTNSNLLLHPPDHLACMSEPRSLLYSGPYICAFWEDGGKSIYTLADAYHAVIALIDWGCSSCGTLLGSSPSTWEAEFLQLTVDVVNRPGCLPRWPTAGWRVWEWWRVGLLSCWCAVREGEVGGEVSGSLSMGRR